MAGNSLLVTESADSPLSLEILPITSATPSKLDLVIDPDDTSALKISLVSVIDTFNLSLNDADNLSKL